MNRRVRAGAVGTVVSVVAALLAAGCAAPEPRPPTAHVGDPRKGSQAIARYGCGACHTIPGIRGADSLVGPPLNDFGRRSFVAGTLPNTAENLARWVQDPDAIRPGTAMPDLDVSEADAQDIAAYLHSLR